MSAKTKRDLITGIAVLAGAAFLFLMTGKMPQNSAVFPRIILALIIFLDILMMGQAWLRRSSNAVPDGAPQSAKAAWIPFIIFGFIVAFVVVFRLCGYFVAAPLLLIGLMSYFRVKSWKLMLSVTAVYSLFIYVLFVTQFKLALI